MAPITYALTLSYQGTDYAGWQRQPNAVSVQQRVEEALSSFLGQETRIHAASRTDAGVHSRGQVAHLFLDREFSAQGLQHGTNRHLPIDIRVMAAHRMSEGFHARKCARAKEYRYRILRGRVLSPLDAPFALRIGGEIDLEALRLATTYLLGEHDFSAFALSGGSHGQPFRTIAMAEWIARGDELELRIEGSGFLRGMVRSIVGTLLEVGGGKRDPGEIRALLEGRPRSESGPTAAAQGLTLQHVLYPEEWQPVATGDVLG